MPCEDFDEIDVVDFLLEREDSRYAAFRAHYPSCSDCTREVRRGMQLEQALGHAAPSSAGDHPSEEVLLAYAQAPATLDFDVRRGLETHLEACAPCTTELTVLERFDFAAIGVASKASTPDASVSLGTEWRKAFSNALEALGGWVVSPTFAAAALAILILPLGWLWVRDEAPMVPAPTLAESSTRPAPESPLVPLDPVDLQELASDEAAKGVSPGALALNESQPEVDQMRAPSPREAEVLPPKTVEVASTPESPSSDISPLVAGPDIALLASNWPSGEIRYGVDQIPLLGGPSVRTYGKVRSAGGTSSLEVYALGPDHVGWTSSTSPTLYYWLSEPTSLPIEITVADDVSIEPLVEFQRGGPQAAGLHAVSLEDLGVELQAGVVYRWQAAAVVDAARRSRDVRASAALVFQERTPAQQVKWEEAELAAQAHLLAEQGYWYDAFRQLSDWTEAGLDVEGVEKARSDLLEQVEIRVPIDSSIE